MAGVRNVAIGFSFLMLAGALAPAMVAPSARAQDADQQASGSKKSKGSGQYEEHYELLPPQEGDPAAPDVPGSGLDPEGGAPGATPSNSGAPASARAASQRRPAASPHKSSLPAAAPSAVPAPPEAEATPAEAEFETAPQPPPESVTSQGRRPASLPNTQAAAAADLARVSDVSFFYDAVEGGAWTRHLKYGDVFVPEVGEDWRPYTQGTWAYSEEYGWTWLSDEPFGWATFHYGRWALEEGRWLWLPDTEWGPAWVVWRYGEDIVGWAPLPPSARFSGGRVSVDANLLEADSYEHAWAFVRPGYFARPEMRKFIRPVRWNADLVDRTQARVGFVRDGETTANRGLAVETLEAMAGGAIKRTSVSVVDDPAAAKARARAGSQVRLYRPGAKRIRELARKTEIKRAARDDSGNAEPAMNTQKPRRKTTGAFKAAPAVERSEAQSGAVTESWGRAPPPRKKQPSPATQTRRTPGPDHESYSTPSPVEAGEGAQPQAAAGRAKRRWDQSGASGAPSAASEPSERVQ